MRMMMTLALGAGLLLLALNPAAASTVVDLSPMAAPVIEIGLTLLAGALLWLLRRAIAVFEDRADMQLDEQMRARLQDALFYAVDFARSKVGRVTAGPLTVDLRNEMVAEAARYAMAAVPQALTYFGIDRGRLVEMIEARLGADLNGDGVVGRSQG
ncbi:inadl protein [Pannonibacter sp. SL95]|uniref:inadl protein n=1 Tax=Pannonibacter sp. SL95 TaxID=2995153 RepID=UPI002276AA30|nr:inadl protein [Pannonibacter sp. SL95]MCY1704471.1 inadl protein [Pannonibacter sp. SL95]MCY1707696.1 inadl protein [Pannonibacter sp. SL95]